MAMDVAERIHEQLTRCGITLAASLPDDWVAPLIERIAADNHIRHVRVAREAEAVAICSGVDLDLGHGRAAPELTGGRSCESGRAPKR